MRLIDADALLQKINNIECVDKHDDIVIKQFVGTIIRNEPTIEAVPAIIGEWKPYNISNLFSHSCSVCNCDVNKKTPYCPWCGAYMKKEE